MKLLLIGLIALTSVSAFSKTICTAICFGAYNESVDGREVRSLITSGSNKKEAIKKLSSDCQELQESKDISPSILRMTSSKYDYIVSSIDDDHVSCTEL